MLDKILAETSMLSDWSLALPPSATAEGLRIT